MKYSIIVPVYNAEKTLERCVDSIISQPFSDYEIILVNDGSKDGSLTLCKKYAENNDNIFYVDKENGGASSARNVGIDVANGEYILFVDSDDYVDENYFDVIDKCAGKADLSVFTFSWVRKSGIQKRVMPDNLVNTDDFFEQVRLLILTRAINSPCAKVFKRQIIDEYCIRFDEGMPVAEDFVFATEYILKCQSVYVDNASVYYYDVTNDDSLVRKKKEGLIDIYPIVFDREFDLLNCSDFNDEQKQQLFRIWDKLHIDSFATCVMEELKDENTAAKDVKRKIKQMCETFYSKYSKTYGYENAVHFFVRYCIKYKMANTLYCFGKAYMQTR